MLSITNTTRGKYPTLPFARMTETVLGKRYELSLVFIGDQRSKTLNNTHRNKNTVASVLSFPLETTLGEIFINLPLAKRRAKQMDMKPSEYAGYLFIHGLCHLKGLDHGSTMDRREKQLCKQFGIPYPE